MVTKTRYQEWVEYHVYHWEQMLQRAKEHGDQEQVELCQRKLAYWRKRVKG